MKKYIIKFAQLILFFGICAPSTVMSMESDIPALPPEVCKLILNKTLRLVLDEIEDDPHQLMAEEKVDSWREFFASYITGKALERYKSTNNIDYILRLIMAKDIGADPNTRNYKGNTALHLIFNDIAHFYEIAPVGNDFWGGGSAQPFKLTKDNIMRLLGVQSKIQFLVKHKINVNATNNEGDTAAHTLLRNAPDINREALWSFMQLLKSVGADMTIKNHAGLTPCELVKTIPKDLFGLNGPAWYWSLKDEEKCSKY